MFLVAEEGESRFCGFNPPLLFIFKGHGLKAHTAAFHINNSNLGHTRSNSNWTKFENNFFQSVQKRLREEERE